MVVVDNFEAPKSAQDLPLADTPDATFLIFFSASNDPETNQPWCSDARAAIPVVDRVFFMPGSPTVHYAYVGVKNEYKGVPTNRFRTDWNIQCIPALVRYARVDGKVVEVGRLVEGELLDEKRVHDLIGS